ncbi:MAG TPA: response regulator [Candidatus Binatia bacterium]|nr:response regulator [Candidatus Binatia bacterium]
MQEQFVIPRDPVLVVEDTDDSRDLLGAILELTGYRVEYATDGRDALDKLEAGLHPSLVLLDVAMPRMDGIELRSRLAEDPRFAGIPVVVFSGVYDIANLRRSLAVPAFRKPVDVDQVLEMVARYCARP